MHILNVYTGAFLPFPEHMKNISRKLQTNESNGIFTFWDSFLSKNRHIIADGFNLL